MAGLIEAIQADALNQSIKIATLLRKVKLAAAKLQLAQVENWVDLELSGYKDGPLPEYRQLTGRPKAHNPYRGWIPIGGDSEIIELISALDLRQPIGVLDELTTGNGQIHVPLSPKQIELLNTQADIQFGEMSVFLDRTQVLAVLESVRTKVLDWAIEMEKQGILGEGMSFDKKEREQAKQLGPTISIGSIANFTGNLGQGQTSGAITAYQSGNEAQVFDDLVSAIRAGIANQGQQERLVASVNELKGARSKLSSFAIAYGKFVEAAADHMTIVAPFLPALGHFLK